MELFWPLILSSIAGLSTIFGSIFIFLPIKKSDSFIVFSLALSLSVMIFISTFDLIPSSLPYLGNNLFKSILLFIIFFLIGVFFVKIVNHLIEKEKGSSNNLYKLGILNFIALVMHNFPEGILTFMSTYHDFKLGLVICIAISLHNIPEGISIAVPIYYATSSKKKALMAVLYSSFAEPFGAIFTFILLKKYITNEIISIFLILVAGIMISLSIEKMLPEALSYQKKKPLIFGLVVGSIIVILSLLFI